MITRIQVPVGHVQGWDIGISGIFKSLAEFHQMANVTHDVTSSGFFPFPIGAAFILPFGRFP
jgi:hypothetical protein